MRWWELAARFVHLYVPPFLLEPLALGPIFGNMFAKWIFLTHVINFLLCFGFLVIHFSGEKENPKSICLEHVSLRFQG